jgi:signal transduction histidine kinase
MAPTILLLLALLMVPPAPAADRAFVDSCNSLPHDRLYSAIGPSIRLYREVVAASRTLEYPRGEAAALARLSLVLGMGGRLDASVEAALAAARIYEELGERKALAGLWGELGYGFKQRDLAQATAWMRQGIHIAETDGRDLLESLYNNYGVLKEMAGELDSAGVYYRRALALAEARPDSSGVPWCLNHLAGLAVLQEDIPTARRLLERSDRLRSAESGPYGRGVNIVLWGDYHLAAGQPDSAEARYREALAWPGAADQPHLMAYCEEKLAGLLEDRGDHRGALAATRRWLAARDSMRNVEVDTRIAALELEYETEKKDRQLAESRLAVARRNRLVAGLGALLLLLAAGAVAWIRHLRRRAERQRRELELRVRLQAAEAEQRLADERQRISGELHDNIGAQLTFLVSSLDNLGRREGAEPLAEPLERLGEAGREALGELRGTVWAMRHEGAGVDEVAHRLRDLGRRFEGPRAPHLEVRVVPGGGPGLGAAQVLAVLRVAQESLANAVKHAAATRVEVELAQDDTGALRLEIRDDGRGFQPAAVGGGCGLDSMRRRCEALGGGLEVDSAPGAGTRITCLLPRE